MSIKSARFITRISQYIMVLFSLCFCLQTLAAAQFKIVTLQHRFAEDILPTVQPLLTGDGTISGVQNHLIIRTSAENMAEIEQIIAALDVARQNIKITVRRHANTNISNSNTNISVRKRIGNIDVITSDHARNSKSGAQIQLDNGESNTQSNSDQFMNVADGERAFISIGQSVPFSQAWVTLTRRYLSVQRTTDFIDINTGFSVRPRSIGMQIEVEITPRIAHINHNDIIDFEALTTTIRVNRGEWLNLGSIMQEKDEVSRNILNWQTNGRLQNSALFIRAD